jgi:hypothetical protein
VLPEPVKGLTSRLFALCRLAGFPGIKQPQNHAEWQTCRVLEYPYHGVTRLEVGGRVI